MRGHFLRAAQKGDADALAYIAAVETADGQALEAGVKTAINAFVVGCKTDGIWNAIKASCILAGARTLAGALIPLAGTAPTNFNFVSGDYNRKTGLLGNASTKYLSSNRKLNDDPLNDVHCSIYVSTAAANGIGLFGNDNVATNTGEIGFYRQSGVYVFRFRSTNTVVTNIPTTATGFHAVSRADNSSVTFRINNASNVYSYASAGSASSSNFISIFSRNAGGSSSTDARIAFYSIGPSLNLSLLDARVTTLINAYAAAIP